MSKWMTMDARGMQSRTLFFVAVSWLVVLVKFLVAGVNMGPLGVMPSMTALEFGGAVLAILGAWVGREWTEKRK